jgi:purine-nucleoside phosphorylase/SAM-dependent methyltransferase
MNLITDHKHYNDASVFTPENLLREARRQKNIDNCNIPDVCVLDPDGDLVEYLIRTGQTTLNMCWACYHTTLYNVAQNGCEFGLVGGGVGASFAVLIAEQLFVSGCKVLLSITSAGIINPAKNTSKFVLIQKALRDEGTSYHYLPPAETSDINPLLSDKLLSYYSTMHFPMEAAISWSTDAPYRETPAAIARAKELNAACVEMEAAALYAFAKAKKKDVVCFAHLTNTMAQTEGDFEKGEEMGSLDALELIHHTMQALKSNRDYWNNIYLRKQPDELSWTQQTPKTSLAFIDSFGLTKNAKIIDIGGGDSQLVDYLLDKGYENITVLDISCKALDKAKKRLGGRASKINWIVCDITEFQPDITFDVWHDRATFHFLTAGEQIDRYIDTARKAVSGYLVIGTFSDKGPERCSGLPVRRYSKQKLTAAFQKGFTKIHCMEEVHTTPFGTKQPFQFCSFRRQLK